MFGLQSISISSAAAAAGVFRLPPRLPFAAEAATATAGAVTGGGGRITTAGSAVASATAGVGSGTNSSSTNGKVPVY